MHLEVLVEDASGAALLSAVLPKICGSWGQPHTWKIIPYKGIGHLPRNLHTTADPAKRVLLHQLPRILAGYAHLPAGEWAVVVVVDVDRRDCVAFKQELQRIVVGRNSKLQVLFRLAVEEMESWLLGDRTALMAVFPDAKVPVLETYVQDSICGTWEVLADVVFPGGAKRLVAEGYPRIGQEKLKWATSVGSRIDIQANRSRSFQVFREGIERLCS